MVYLVTAWPGLLAVAPESESFNHPVFLEHLVYQPMLNIDLSRIRLAQVADELFERRGPLERIVNQDGRSWIAMQSSSETSTALFLFPVISSG